MINLKNIMMNMKNYRMLKKIELDGKYKCINVELKDYDYKEIFPEEKLEKEEKSYDVPPGIKILTLSKLLTRLIYQHK